MEYDQLLSELANAFRSARLEYVRVSPTDTTLKSFLPRVVHDPIIQAMSSSSMLQPKSERDIEETIQWLSGCLLGVAICLQAPDKSDGIGDTIGFICINYESKSLTTTQHRTATIGISLATSYQDQGYGREAINWMMDWGFKHAGLHTIGILVASYNPRALHLYQSLGFVVEGRRRETIWQNRKWYDLVELGITESEWLQLRALPASN